MVIPVKRVDRPRRHVPRTNWQVLGQLKLTQGSNPDGTIKAWLLNVVGEFSLPGDLIRRFLASIQEATARVLSPDSIQARSEYLEIVVLAPAGQTTKGHTWGFFRVERTSTNSHSESARGHRVEYYLYLDRK